MPEYVKGVELTQDGMRAIFDRMGKNITSGIIYNGNPEIRTDVLDQQGFMPILTAVSPTQESGHWIMLIKGKGNQYYLFDPLGEHSGKGYQNILSRKLPQDATLSVIPNGKGVNMGLCGYWVASAGVRAHATLTGDNSPTLENLGQTITQEMQNELAGNGYGQITAWLRAVANEFPAGDAKNDATALRLATTGKTTTVKETPIQSTVPQVVSEPALESALLEHDEDVRSIVNYVHKEYLRHDYPGPLVDPKNPNGERLKPNEGPDRGTHGLAHTVRTMACAEVMVEEARKAEFRGEKLGTAKNGQTLADITPEELKKILIAQAFFVVGRDDERSGYDSKYKRNFYEEYHEKSEQAFRKCVEENKLIGKIFKDQKEVDHYAAIILDKPHNWDGTPAHVLIHQGHMVDLMRVKAPQEVVLERAYYTLKNSLGSRGAEVVLKTHREFFLATGAVVPQFNPEAKEDPSRGGPYENPYNGDKYVIEEGKIPESKNIQRVDSNYRLKENERFVSIKEYYAIPEIQKSFPGYKTYLKPSPYSFPTDFAKICEQNPTSCLDAIRQARSKIVMGVIKETLQSDPEKAKRVSNRDEIAAARIIQQIMANPDVIQDDHVFLNGQKLEESFFRDLLTKCDMTIVGSLLSDTDINNVDQLMQHELDTEFHPTDLNEPAKKLGDTWEKNIRKKDSREKNQIKLDLINLMQNNNWYAARVNAIAQNKDKNSTFKEVLLASLLTPLTNKALVDTKNQEPSPQILFRGFNIPKEFQQQLIKQANTIIANTENYLFTTLSSHAFMQIKLDEIASKTKSSEPIFDSNTIFEINDPEQLLTAKQVEAHESVTRKDPFYLPEHVALVPTKVTLDGKTSTGVDRYVVSFVAVKNPDFVPNHDVGFAAAPIFKMQSAKVMDAINAIQPEDEETHKNLNESLKSLRLKLVEQSHLPIRGGFLDRILHYFSGKDDQKISLSRKNFLNEKVIPALQECHIALRLNNIDMMLRALAKFPADEKWADFKSDAAKNAKKEMDNLRPLIEKKIALQRQLAPLVKCQDALEKQQATEAIKALESIPSDKNIPSISKELREKIQQTKHVVLDDLEPLQRPIITSPLINSERAKIHYETRILSMDQRIATLETTKLDDLTHIKKKLSYFNTLQEEVKVLRNERAQMHIGTGKIDFTDVEKLEEQLRTIHSKLYDAYVVEVAEEINSLEEETPKNLTAVKEMISSFNDRLAEVEQLRQEKTRKHETSKEPLNLSDIDALKDRLQKINQFLTKALINNIRVSLNQMEVKTFDTQVKEAQRNLQLLDKLATTLDDSETTQKHKEDIVKLNEFFGEKQKAYPAMVQLQFKSEALIIRLRELCEAHQNHLAESRKTKTEELTKNRWMLQGLTDLVGLTTDQRTNLNQKGKALDQFKEDLNNDTYDIQELIHTLAQKSPKELEEAIGISTENAEKIHALLKNLNHSTTFVAKIEERAKLIDTVLVELDKISIQPELTHVSEEPQNTFNL
ncbi:Homologous to SidE substrate of Dot/Icm secretion system [Legionella sainthelensi]|uniref:SidE phosphodiesterase domain-containing protein n=1 Tax=Legionella sainthelensi TaxID=28087 RepID=UPI000F7069FA|nr:SidE phosphodiesterase domain-containing protein [Legionella sainthelensi]VEB33325.1 Homologous to SidE substrate of Dot/Icm secretion system [Legionella sainthelensi]